MSSPRNDTIPNQDSNRIIIQQYQILPTLLSKFPTINKPFIDNTYFSNKTEYEHNYSTDNSRTENKDSVNTINVDKYEDKDDKYKEDNSEDSKSNESVINKT